MSKEQYVVVAGKWEYPSENHLSMVVNYKYISEPVDNLTDAIKLLDTVRDYPYHDIEYTDLDGNIWLMCPCIKE